MKRSGGSHEAYGLELNGLDKFICTSGNFRGTSPLYLAAGQVDIGAVKSLLLHGVPADIKNWDDSTPLQNLVSSWNDEDDAARKCAKVLFDAGANLDLPSGLSKHSPIHIAAILGHNDAIRWLAENGANLTLADKSGRTPAQIAKECGHPDTAELIHQILLQ